MWASAAIRIRLPQPSRHPPGIGVPPATIAQMVDHPSARSSGSPRSSPSPGRTGSRPRAAPSRSGRRSGARAGSAWWPDCATRREESVAVERCCRSHMALSDLQFWAFLAAAIPVLILPVVITSWKGRPIAPIAVLSFAFWPGTLILALRLRWQQNRQPQLISTQSFWASVTSC